MEKKSNTDFDEKLKDYDPALIVAAYANRGFNDYAHLEKKIFVHKLPLNEQKKLLMKAFLMNDENYIYEFDKETKKMREKLKNDVFGLSMVFTSYYGFSNYFFWKKIRPIKSMKIEWKFLYLMAVNLVPLLYFGYEINNEYCNLDDFLFNKYLNK